MSDAIDQAIAGAISGLGGDVSEADVSTPSTETTDVSTDTATTDTTETGTTEQQVADPAAGTTTTDPAATVDPTKATAAVVNPDVDPDTLEALELAGKDSKGRHNPVPYHRVVRIAENAAKKRVAVVEGGIRKAFGLGDTDALDVNDLGKRYRETTEEMSAMRDGEKLMFENPREFLGRLANLVPAYRELVNLGGQAQSKGDTGPAPAEPPQPDIDLGNGRATYSPEGLRKLVAFEREQAGREVEERIMKRFGPIEQQFTEKQRADKDLADRASVVESALADAATWDGYKENEAAIQAELRNIPPKKGRTLVQDLHEAYRRVVLPKFKADRESMRTELLAEISKQPKNTSESATTVAASAVAQPGEDPTEAIIRKSIAGLK